MTQPVRPFADAVLAYAQAGWPCILPVPLEKSPPPVGFTGAEGRDTDPVQLVAWSASHADSSIAIRMPDGVIGIDVDSYVKAGVTKHGDLTLAAAIERWGALPATWCSTARAKTWVASGIRFYRVPVGRYATKLEGGDVEIIQRHHRYAVVWPSPHPEAGDIYRWYDPNGLEVAQPPKINELPWLPEAWVQGLAEGASAEAVTSASYGAGETMLAQLLADNRVACADITSAAMQAVTDVTKADAGSRHDTMTGRVHQLVQLGAVGHPGVGVVLTHLRDVWDQLTAGENRGEEFERMLLTTARKAVTSVGATQVAHDPCLLTAGGVQQPAPAPGGEPSDELPDAPLLWNVRQYIGAHAFDPMADTDQTLAQAVLERTWPMLRYAADSKGWLRRGPEYWEHFGDLSSWGVAQLAELMPVGDGDAEKGSAEQRRAARRTRFLAANTANRIASKMRDIVVGGAHPCAVNAAELDSESWLIWAGGVAWDLRASTELPVVAPIDPGTPHIRAARGLPQPGPTPLWDEFVAAVWPDPELRAWALRVLSVTFTGQSDAVLPLLIGESGRGKTQVVALLMRVLGSYAHAASNKLLDSGNRSHDSIITALKGRRLSFIDEAPHDGAAGQERLKQLTGGGELTGNQMNQNPITFAPTHTLVLTANHEPNLTDPALRRRVRLIPCEGDPEQVRAARYALGRTSGTAWRREAPAVLAAMIVEAGRYLADEATAATDRAPEAYRWRAETIAAEQNLEANWVADMTEPADPGERAHALYVAFVAWCKDANVPASRIPSETKWGRTLTQLGYPSVHMRNARLRNLRIRLGGSWFTPAPSPESVTGSPSGDGLVTGQSTNPSQPLTPANTDVISTPVTGVTGSMPADATGARTHTPETAMQSGGQRVTPVTTAIPISAQISSRLVAAKEANAQANPTAPAKPKRTKVDPEVRAAEKLAAKAEALTQAIATAGGGTVQLPAIVTRDGAVRAITNDGPAIADLFAAFGITAEMTVDVEHTGYPIGHADYALRTVQLGNEQVAVVFDADDIEQLSTAKTLLAQAQLLHAHSATADLVPLAVAGVIDFDAAWVKMADTVIPALLADPQSTGSDADGLKQLAADVLGQRATAPAADQARAELFKTGKWLTNTKPTTPRERSGWAQVDKRSTTMVRYAASDVLDTAALARALPAPPPVVLAREHTAQVMTSRISHQGVALDGALIDRLMPEHQAALAQAGGKLEAFGVSNAGSDQQVAAVAVRLGAQLPTTKTGRTSVARGALEQYRRADGPLGDFVRARLDYQHHETVLGLFLEPYSQLVHRGDGRARPTVYTLGADTGRMSSVRPNLQQVPRQGGIRPIINADPGEVGISADFASVEVRVAAALTGDTNLQAMLEADVDLHWTVARQAYGSEASKEDRYGTKRGVFGWFYGSGIPGIARTLAISEGEASMIVDSLRTIAPGLAPWIDGLKQAVRGGMKSFETYSGRVVHLDPRLPHKAFNYLVQGTARELLVDTLIRWRDTPWGHCRLMPVHDEVLVFVPEADAEAATAALVACMESTLYGVRIKAEASEPSFAWKDAS